jgi:hypothetical protein
MIGGSPVFVPQLQMAPPGYGYAPPAYQQAPAPRYAPPPQQQFVPRPQPVAQQPAPVRPVVAATPPPRIRGQSEDEQPEIKRLVLPAPEALGVTVAGSTADLATLQRRLDQLGAQCFHLDRVNGGRLKLVCLFPTSEAGRAHRIEAEAVTAVDAASLVVQRAEDWQRSR